MFDGIGGTRRTRGIDEDGARSFDDIIMFVLCFTETLMFCVPRMFYADENRVGGAQRAR